MMAQTSLINSCEISYLQKKISPFAASTAIYEWEKSGYIEWFYVHQCDCCIENRNIAQVL